MSLTFAAYATTDGLLEEIIDGPRVNLNNANAAAVLRALEYPNEPMGEDDAHAFHERVLLALALNGTDPGRVARVEGRFIHCGRPAGRLTMTLDELGEIAHYAKARGYRVGWA